MIGRPAYWLRVKVSPFKYLRLKSFSIYTVFNFKSRKTPATATTTMIMNQIFFVMFFFITILTSKRYRIDSSKNYRRSKNIQSQHSLFHPFKVYSKHPAKNNG